MAKIGGGSGRMEEYKFTPEKKSIKTQRLLAAASRKKAGASTILKQLRKLLPMPGLGSQTVLLDLLASPSTAGADSHISDTENTEKMAQFLFENGGRWPTEKGFHQVDPTEALDLYQAKVQQAALNQIDESDGRLTPETMQFYDESQQKSFQDRSAEFLRNMTPPR